jgi:hypothetical protein
MKCVWNIILNVLQMWSIDISSYDIFKVVFDKFRLLIKHEYSLINIYFKNCRC